MRRPSLIMPVLFLLAGASRLWAGEPVRFQTADLGLGSGVLAELSDSVAVILAPDGVPTRTPLDALNTLFVTRERTHGEAGLPAPPDPHEARLFVELVGGQRVIAELGGSDNPDALRGVVLGLGVATIPLERVARIARPGAPWHAPAPEADEVYLTNNDRLTGFVASIGPTVTIESPDGSSARIPLGRVREIRLANPRRPEPGLLVTDDLGVTLRAHSLSVGPDGRLRLTTDGGAFGLDSHGEDATAYDRPEARLRVLHINDPETRTLALSTLTPTTVRPTGDRAWTPRPEVRPCADADPMLGVGDIVLPAPAEVVYDLPAGADRFACTVVAEGGDWTDCAVRVLGEQGDGSRAVVWEGRLTGASAPEQVAADLAPGTARLVLLVEPGRYGAVQDTVVFGWPRVRVRE